MGADLIAAGYAMAVTAGGLAGYLKAGSTASLGAGLLFGGILGFGAYQLSQNPNNYYVTLGASTVLAGVMGSRFYKSGKIMPAGLVAALSIGMMLRLGMRVISPVKNK